MRQQYQERLVTAFTPAQPLWAVYYDEEADTIDADPVLLLNVWEHTISTNDDEGSVVGAEIRPVPFSSDSLMEESQKYRSENFLGLSLTQDLDRARFQNAIEQYQSRHMLRECPATPATTHKRGSTKSDAAKPSTDPFQALKRKRKVTSANSGRKV
jgi:hypothetical protein